MNRVRLYALVATVLLLSTGLSSGESLAGRHQIGLNVGFWSQVTDARTEIGLAGVTTSVKSSGTMGGITYGHWLNDKSEVILSAGGLRATVRTAINFLGVSSETAVVTPILIGAKRYVLLPAGETSVRPFLSASVGGFIGSQTTSQAGITVVTESRTETAFGGLVGGGVDFVLSHRFLANVAVGYNLMTDFQSPIGGSKNYSGPQMTFGISVLLGRGSQPN